MTVKIEPHFEEVMELVKSKQTGLIICRTATEGLTLSSRICESLFDSGIIYKREINKSNIKIVNGGTVHFMLLNQIHNLKGQVYDWIMLERSFDKYVQRILASRVKSRGQK